jgi:hypothetical protein
MRGAAPSAVCPRCGTETSPSDAALITCASCKLGFDPRAEPARRPPRRETKEYQPAPLGMTIRREPGEWTIAWTFDRIKGAGALGLGVLCAAVLVGNLSTPDEQWYHLAGLGAAALGMLYIGLVWSLSRRVVRVDGRQMYALSEPLRWGSRIWIGRHEIERVELRAPTSSARFWAVVVIAPRGEFTVGTFDERARDIASCIADTLREALDEIEAI